MVNLHRKHSLEHELFCLDDFNNWSRLYDGPKVSCCIDNIYLRPKVYIIYGCCRYVIIVRTLIQLRPLHTILTSMMCIKWVGTATAMHSYDHSRPHCLSYVCGGPWTIAVPLTLELLYIIYCLAIIWAYHLSRYIYIHAYWCYIPATPKSNWIKSQTRLIFHIWKPARCFFTQIIHLKIVFSNRLVLS